MRRVKRLLAAKKANHTAVTWSKDESSQGRRGAGAADVAGR